MKHISYPKTPQFVNVIRAVSSKITYVGPDENGDPVYDNSIPKPKLTFKGTVKVHGTNAGVSYNKVDGIYTQSRNNAFNMENAPTSHQGFTHFVLGHKEVFQGFFDDLVSKHNITDESITIYGEWAGSGIQKGVAVSQLPKAFYIFGVKISKPADAEFEAHWVDYDYRDNDSNIYNIDDFGVYEVEVDFNMPQYAQVEFEKLTLAIEDECPVGKHFGVSGVGEGLVWVVNYKGSRHHFKTKGQKHSASKVKKVASVDIEKGIIVI